MSTQGNNGRGYGQPQRTSTVTTSTFTFNGYYGMDFAVKDRSWYYKPTIYEKNKEDD